MADALDDYRLACQINDAYRRARLNVIYYGWRLDRMRTCERAVEIAVAIGTSAAVATLAVWRNDVGRLTFNGIVALAVVLVTAKPILNLPAAVARLSKMWATYSGAYETLARLNVELHLRNGVVPGAKPQLLDALNRIAAVHNEEDWSPSAKWANLAQDMTERELPVDRLWYPSGSAVTSPASAAAAGSAAAGSGSETSGVAGSSPGCEDRRGP